MIRTSTVNSTLQTLPNTIMSKEIEGLSTADIKAAYRKLTSLKKKQASLKAEEEEIRCYLADTLVPEQEEGAKTFDFNDIKVTVQRPVYRNIKLDEAERLGQELDEDVALSILSWSPKVRVSGYRKHQDIADEYITTSFGTPSVKFTEVDPK